MRLAVAIGFVLASLFAASAQKAPASAPKPTGLVLLPDTDKGHYATPLPAKTFAETQQRQLMLVTFDKSAAGQQLNFAVRALATTASSQAVVLRADATVSDQGLVPIQVRLPRNWPVGHYDVLVTQNGQPVAALPYRVVAEPARITPLSFGDIRIDRVVAPGKTEPAEPVKASYRHLNFSAKATGANTDGINLTWVFTAVDTQAGAREVNRIDQANRPVDNTELQFDINLPRDWPLGRYRVDLFVDGKPAVSRGFTIEP